MRSVRVEIKYCEGCGKQCLKPYHEAWQEVPSCDKYCSRSECQMLAAKPIYEAHTRDGRLSWANPPVYDPFKEAELARIGKRITLVPKESIQ